MSADHQRGKTLNPLCGWTVSGLGKKIGILCPEFCARKMRPFSIWPLTKDASIIIGNRYQIEFSPDLLTSRFPGNFRIFSGHSISILIAEPTVI